MRRTAGILLIVLAFAATALRSAGVEDSIPGLSLTTPDRLQNPGWWPTKGTAVASDYVGSAACAQCHGDIAASQSTTPMAQTGPRAMDSAILKAHPSLAFHEGGFSYAVQRTAAGVSFSVNDGSTSASQPVTWAFGDGVEGQTFLLKKDGQYTEARLSYYTSLHALNITTGHSEDVPASLQQAFGTVLKTDVAQHCFACHTTAPTVAGNFVPEKAIPGVTCEQCHGPGAKHVAAMKAGRYDLAAATILNPASLAPGDSVDFCGACHRTWSDVTMLLPPRMGVVVVRFQPYRLEKSRCWGQAGDARLTCIACHDPHKPLVTDMAAYDNKCLACHRSLDGHSAPKATASACKVATRNCASCHMQKIEIPQTHALFTDHDIRIVRAGASVPE